MRVALLLAGLSALAHGATMQKRDTDKVNRVPEGWTKVGKPDLNERLVLHIGMAHPDPVLLHRTLNDIADPDHARYGMHLKRNEIKRLVRPSAAASESVRRWLSDAGVEERDIFDDGDFIKFSTTVKRAEEMLETRFHTFRHENGVQAVRTTHYSLPRDLSGYIDTVQPTTHFDHLSPQLAMKQTREAAAQLEKRQSPPALPPNATCAEVVTPACLRQLYNVRGFTPNPQTSGFIGVTGFEDQLPRFTDINRFLRRFAPDVNPSTLDFVSLQGGTLNQNSPNESIEANLDIDITLPLTFPMRNRFYSVGGLSPRIPDLDYNIDMLDDTLDVFTFLLNAADDQLPHTLTTSYGFDEQTVPRDYARRLCNTVGALGARGVSVIFASGDTGPGMACLTNDGRNATRFTPLFPASCPYVTSVGGTTGTGPERAVSLSGGGFSDMFERPAYQDSAVAQYLDFLGNDFDGLFNRNGRGIPDVSAQALHLAIGDQGNLTAADGTSASAPIWAGIVALLNAARLEQGQPPLGFLNPWLYKRAFTALNDVTRGRSTGCPGTSRGGDITPRVPGAGFNATVGWDASTGLGTPDFSKLLPLALSYQASSNSTGPGNPPYGGYPPYGGRAPGTYERR